MNINDYKKTLDNKIVLITGAGGGITISPGLVKTETAMKSIEVVAKSMNISLEEFYEMNKEHIISVEDAALGFALSVLNAKEYNG